MKGASDLRRTHQKHASTDSDSFLDYLQLLACYITHVHASAVAIRRMQYHILPFYEHQDLLMSCMRGNDF